MESFNYLLILIVLTVSFSQTYSEETKNHNGDYRHPALYFDKKDSGWNTEHLLQRYKRQNNKQENGNAVDKPKPPPENPLEHLILNHDKGLESGASLSRVKRQYSESESNSIESVEDSEDISAGNGFEDDDYEGRYPYPYPVPILVGGGIGGFGGYGYGRGFGGPGFGGKGFGGRGFGGRGGGFGGRGGGFGGGRGGGRG